jgi:hypothetical protein
MQMLCQGSWWLYRVEHLALILRPCNLVAVLGCTSSVSQHALLSYSTVMSNSFGSLQLTLMYVQKQCCVCDDAETYV